MDTSSPWYIGSRSEDRHWPPLRTALEADGWSPESLNDLSGSADKVVAQLPNPHGADYQCRGLVLGYVQSGKTTNFTAVIAKAADAGYRFFIVLSGMHNALRWQTQQRLNEQLCGLNTDLWHKLTNEDDFRFGSAHADAFLSSASGPQRVMAVVKKHGSRLRALKRWLSEADQTCSAPAGADHRRRSGPGERKHEQTGPGPDHHQSPDSRDRGPAPKSAYVGYTATPFANVLIDPSVGDDLYPRDFIVDLPRPARYIGPETIFAASPSGSNQTIRMMTDTISCVSFLTGRRRRPSRRAERPVEASVPDSLDAALRYFLLSSAARRARGKGNRHATALVHTSQLVAVHHQTAAAITAHLNWLARRLAAGEQAILTELRDHTGANACACPQVIGRGDSRVADVANLLPVIASDVRVIVDNSESTSDSSSTTRLRAPSSLSVATPCPAA